MGTEKDLSNSFKPDNGTAAPQGYTNFSIDCIALSCYETIARILPSLELVVTCGHVISKRERTDQKAGGVWVFLGSPFSRLFFLKL